MRDEIIKGMDRSFEKLVAEKKKSNSELAFAEANQVVTVKAVEL